MIEREVVYRRDGEREWVAQVYAPEGAAGCGLIVDVHGGAWSGGNRFAGQKVDRVLVEALGVAVLAIEFRLAPADPYPAMMQDLNYAIRWAKANAAELGARPEGVGAIGWSSGGHMALLAGVRPKDDRYGALRLPAGTESSGGKRDASLAYVVACWPPLDPLARYRFAKETGRETLVRNSEGCFGDEETMAEASVTRVVAEGEAQARPPVLIVQGTADANIPLPMVEGFAETYRAAGGVVQLEVFRDEPHGFISRGGEAAERALEAIVEFVRARD